MSLIGGVAILISLLPHACIAADPVDLTLPSGAGQSQYGISLQVTPVSSGGMTTSQTNVASVSVIEKLKIHVQNIGHESRDLTVDWYFFSRPTTSHQLACYDKGEKIFTVAAGDWNDFVAKSIELQAVNATRFTPGVRIEGWIVLVKADGKIIDFKTANSSLEDLLRDPDDFAKVLSASPNPAGAAAPQPQPVAAASVAPQPSPAAQPSPSQPGLINSIKGLIFGN